MIALAFALTSAITFGQLDTITQFLTDLSKNTIVLGPLDLSPALLGSVLLVLVSGGVNLMPKGANSKENKYAAVGLAALFLLMGLSDFRTWVSGNSAVSILLFLVSIAGYSVIGGVGIGSEDNDSYIKKAGSKVTGGYL